MPDAHIRRPKIAIVDYGMGNLFSVRQACGSVGLDAEITSSPDSVLAADGVILPGIGGFPDAMRTLRASGLVEALQGVAAAGTPLVGICLGMQLLMDESQEFGSHRGLGLIPGTVERFPDGPAWKVPHVGWNRIRLTRAADSPGGWDTGGLLDGDFMYFVHSYHVRPASADMAIATASYAGVEFCAALGRDNVLAWQFHPERSGPRGLQLYECLAQRVKQPMEACANAGD